MINKKLEIILLLIILSLLVLWEISVDIIVFIMIGILLLFGILLLYGWENGIIIGALKKAGQDVIEKRLYTILVVIILALLLIWKFNIISVILWMIFCMFLLYVWDSRILAGTALAFLASCPILLIYKKESIAEQMAIYAYYFLVMAVVLQIVDYINPKKREEEVIDDGIKTGALK